MAITIHSSVLLDVLLADPGFGEKSKRALELRRSDGLTICEVALAEIVSVLRLSAAEFLRDSGIQFVPSSEASAILAGEMYRDYLARGGTRTRILPDFLIGAHAQMLGLPLLARDAGYFRDYFRNLVVITP